MSRLIARILGAAFVVASVASPIPSPAQHGSGGSIALQPYGGYCADAVGNAECFLFAYSGCPSALAQPDGRTVSIVVISDVAGSLQRTLTYGTTGAPVFQNVPAYTFIEFRDIGCAPLLDDQDPWIRLGSPETIKVPRSAHWMIVTAYNAQGVEWSLAP